MRRLASSLLLVAATASGLFAQTYPLASKEMPSVVESGVHQNNSDRAAVVFERILHVQNASWMRLIIDEASLPRGSYLEVISVLDAHRHRIDAAELDRWSKRSAYMNGSMLLLRLVAGPGTRGVFFKTSKLEVGVPSQRVDPASQCGPQDNRVPSTDKRTGRLLPAGCTAWLISSQNCFITAGHCRSSSQMTVEFNVPASSSGGQIRHPGPQDQYPVDMSTVNGNTGGVGNDWAVFKTRVNGTTNKHAGVVQGAYFNVAYSKPSVNSAIRITGYGVDRDQPSRSQTNQTHAGPLQTNSGTRLCYKTDTEGGNSGSPVIDDKTGNAVGVHTHGGCSTSGSGCNSGTSTTNSAFASAVRGLMCAPPFCNNTAGFSTFGSGCATASQGCAVSFQQNWQQKLANETTTATKIGILEFSRPRFNACAIDLWTKSRSGNVTVNVSLNDLDPNTGGPGKVLSSGKVTIGTSEQMYTAKLSPVVIAKDTAFVIVFDNADKIVLPTAPSGTSGFHYEFRNNTWGNLLTTNMRFQYRVHHDAGNVVPKLSNTDRPILGNSFAIDLSDAPTTRAALLLVGASDKKWGAFKLPLDLGLLGASGCSLLTSPDVIVGAVTNGSGTASTRFPLPKVKSLCNLHVYAQYVVLDPKANKLGMVFTNGGDAHLGSQ